MPEWFKTLGFVTVATIMVGFLLSVVAAIVITVIVLVKDFIDDRRIKRRRNRDASKNL